MTNYINEEHTACDEDQTRSMVSKLQFIGWDVRYGTGAAWEFESDHDRALFEGDLSDVMCVVLVAHEEMTNPTEPSNIAKAKRYTAHRKSVEARQENKPAEKNALTKKVEIQTMTKRITSAQIIKRMEAIGIESANTLRKCWEVDYSPGIGSVATQVYGWHKFNWNESGKYWGKTLQEVSDKLAIIEKTHEIGRDGDYSIIEEMEYQHAKKYSAEY